MSSQIDKFYVGDDRPIIELTVEDEDGNALDLSVGGLDLDTATGHVQFVQPRETTEVLNRACLETDLPNGRIDFKFEKTDFTTRTSWGKIALWVVLVFNDATQLTTTRRTLLIVDQPLEE